MESLGAPVLFANLLALVLILNAARLIARQGRLEAEREAARFQTVFDAVPDGIVTVSADGRVEAANEQAHRLFRYPVGGLVGVALESLFSERLLNARRAVREDALGVGSTRHVQEMRGNRKDGSDFLALVTVRVPADPAAATLVVVEDVSEIRRRDSLLNRLAEALIHSTNGVAIADADGRAVFVNPAYEQMSGQGFADVVGQPLLTLRPDRPECAQTWGQIESGVQWSGPTSPRAFDPDATTWDALVSPILDESGELTGIFEIWQDRREEVDLEERLIQAEKLKAVGELAAGMAHEINTPVQFVGDNLRFLRDGTSQLVQLGTDYNGLLRAARLGVVTEDVLQEYETRRADADLDFLLEEIPRAIDQSIEGVEHVATIVRAMKAYSHPATDKAPSDLNAAIANAITVSRNEWKYVAEVVAELDPTLPMVTCSPGQLNQVILNLIVNAAHAIEEQKVRESMSKGLIVVRSRWTTEYAEIEVEDDGCGIPPEVQARVFEHFFTTKAVGRGTGQGLTTVHRIIVDNHGGEIDFTSTPGEGSRFTVRLPLQSGQGEAVA